MTAPTLDAVLAEVERVLLAMRRGLLDGDLRLAVRRGVPRWRAETGRPEVRVMVESDLTRDDVAPGKRPLVQAPPPPDGPALRPVSDGEQPKRTRAACEDDA